MTEKILALDTEDDSKGNVFLINFFDGHRHATFQNRKDAWNYLQDQGPCVVWACNMEYDLINLFGDWIDKILVLTFNTSAFIKAYWPKRKVRFLDTLRHWPMSVKSMGDFIGLPKLEPKGTSVERFNDVTYCRRDTEIVWRFVQKMTETYAAVGATMESTLPSSAFKLFKNRYANIALQRPNEEICDKLMGAAYGGRVEIFRTGLLHGRIECFDINSLYPSCMSEETYPRPDSGAFRPFSNLDHEGILFARISYPNDVQIPALPFRRNGKLVFPVGRFEGAWCMPEVRRAIFDGARIEKVHWFYQYNATCRPFKEYVDDIYARRKAATDPFLSYTLKIFMNSVYGKFTESGALSIFKNGHESKLSRRPDHSNVVLSAYTTAYGRLRLLAALRMYEKWVAYCDTDSIFLVDGPFVPTGPNLGEWKREAVYSQAEFVLPKCYMAVNADGVKSGKVKGVPRSAVQDFFKTYRAEYHAPLRFRESRRRMLPPNVWSKRVRSLKSKYEKRTMLANGLTIPLRIK